MKVFQASASRAGASLLAKFRAASDRLKRAPIISLCALESSCVLRTVMPFRLAWASRLSGTDKNPIATTLKESETGTIAIGFTTYTTIRHQLHFPTLLDTRAMRTTEVRSLVGDRSSPYEESLLPGAANRSQTEAQPGSRHCVVGRTTNGEPFEFA
jgi:hypothetical protein